LAYTTHLHKQIQVHGNFEQVWYFSKLFDNIVREVHINV